MIYVDDNTKERIEKIKDKFTYYLVNFDNVITDCNSCDTWSAITSNIKLKKRYIKKDEELKFKCTSIELDSSITSEEKCEAMRNAWKEKLDLLRSLNIDKNKLIKYITNKSDIELREGIVEYFQLVRDRKIPIIIISDGIYEVIECLLNNNNCNFDNIKIIANKLYDIEDNIIVHPLNKNESSVPSDIQNKLVDKKTSVLFASSINDINMLSKANLKDSIKVAFLEHNINENFDTFLNYFNVICTHNTSFEQVVEKIKSCRHSI